ncbi:M56 family metallopeptidase [Sphingomonas sp. BGYR3]|uniref:M56 family metallopeptidase n=1 Tax=Sphingomonas sp. BGYR3 TaxID=2975483 RepID=UPI0021A6981C|nr:M56 family metallopeptidase [Sphingomonas sp. BGYR3]MDG5487033.1 M56 family metallopeptidase [Sphingomonas sp. BGYR3]
MIGWAVETLVATTLLMLLVLAIRGPVRARFGPHIAYALWSIPLARMVLPPLPGDWQWSALFAPAVERMRTAEVVAGALDPSALPADLADRAIPLALAGDSVPVALVPPTLVTDGAPVAALMIALWIVGGIAFLGYHLVAHALFVARLQRSARLRSVVADGTVRVIETDETTGPLAFGIWRKTIAFPSDFGERYDEQERALALAHELGHHARGDLIANWAALAMLALHWFNPVAWRAYRAFRADQELACDALVLAGRPQSLRHAYGRAIVKSAHGGAVSAACHLHTINDLKGRLKMLTKHEPTPRSRVVAGGITLTGIALAGLALTASGTAAAKKMREGVERATGVELAAIDLPSAIAPLAPAAPAQTAEPATPETPAKPALPEDEAKRTVKVIRVDKGDARVITVDRGLDQQVLDGLVADKKLWRENAEKLARMPEIQIPEIREGKCGKGDGMMVQRTDDKVGGKSVTVICTDRIEAMTLNATRLADVAMADAKGARVLALRSRTMGLSSAMMGLRHARKSIEMQDSLSADQKREALAGIDQAIREIAQEQQSPEE